VNDSVRKPLTVVAMINVRDGMKRARLGPIILFVGIVAAIAVAVRSDEPEDTFVNSRDAREYLYLRSRNRFFLQEIGAQRSGRYVIRDSALILQSREGEVSTALIRGDTLIDHHDEKWIRQ
jgi:hypothetical protein